MPTTSETTSIALRIPKSTVPPILALDYIQPRFFIPIHYRTDRKSDPIPEGHWPPNIDDPFAFIEDLREGIGDKTRILPFTAGVQYEVEMPAKQVVWNWRWFNSWDDEAPGWLSESMVD